MVFLPLALLGVLANYATIDVRVAIHDDVRRLGGLTRRFLRSEVRSTGEDSHPTGALEQVSAETLSGTSDFQSTSASALEIGSARVSADDKSESTTATAPAAAA